MVTKYYEYWFYYDDVQIKNIAPVKSKIFHLTLCFPWSFQNCPNNEAYYFEQYKSEINLIKQLKETIMITNSIMMA